MKYLPLILLLAHTGAQACTTEVHIGSYHASGEFNETNPGLGGECIGWQAGGYRISISKTSLYAERHLNINKYFGLRAGVATGYGIDVLPYVGLYSLFMGNELTVFPKTKVNPLTVGYSVRF